METSKTEQGTVNRTYNPPAGWAENREEAFSLIREERRNQFIKWGVRTYDDGTWAKILAEEFGEVAKEMLTIQFARNEEERELAVKRLEKEAIQLAAVAAAIVQQIKSGNA